MRTMLKMIAILACFALVLAGCSGGGDTEAVDLNSYTLDEIIAKAQEEGDVQSVGMPDYWANWGLSWEGLADEYGLTHTDADMSSAEELTTFENDPTKDIGDVGLAFTQQAIDEAKALIKEKIPTELHVYPFGHHGLSVCVDGVEFESCDKNHIHVSNWVRDCSQWTKLV